MDEQLNIDRHFISELLKAAPNHAEWLKIMEFGMMNLLREPDFLINAVVTEAQRLSETSPDWPSHTSGCRVPQILSELKLEIVSSVPWRNKSGV